MEHKIVELVSTKPSGVQWYSDAHPEEDQKYLEWARTVPGVVFLTKSFPDENTVTRIFIFENNAAYENYIAVHRTNEHAINKQKYNSDNKIVLTINVLDE